MSFLFGLLMRFIARISDRLSSSGRFLEHLFFRGLDAAGRTSSLDRWLSGFFFRVTSPVRWLSSKLRGGGRTESVFSRFIAWMLWPFFYLVDRMDRLGRPRERSFSDRDFQADERQIQKRIDQDLKTKLVNQHLERTWISRLGQAFMAPFVGVFDFVWQLLATRRLGLWLWSLPLVLITGLLASVFFSAWFGQDSQVIARYEAALSQAIKSGDTDKVKLYRLKLAQFGSSTTRGEFQTALALSEKGEILEAYALMSKLAPVDSVGFESAHFWIAQKLIEGVLDIPEPGSLTLALKHLDKLRSCVGDEPEIRLLEGLAYARLGRIPAAINSLRPISRSNVVASFLLMEIFAVQGNQTEAKEQAINVHRTLSEAISQGQDLTEDQRKWQTAATKIIGDAKLASDAVEQWYRANPESVEARSNRTRLLVQQVNEWCQRPDPGKLEEMKQNLIRAAATVPDGEATMVSTVATLVAQRRTQNPTIESLYQHVLADQTVSGLIIEPFGTLAAVKQDWALADALFQRATTVSPNWGNAWNNWAYVISASFPERLEEALRYADRAIQINPENPDYRETRGMIYYKLRNYEQAIADLEIAINGINELASVHAALADSHRRLGNDSVAEIYERQTSRRRN
jgi:tetratricopeptide (TPR) repeat protein